MSIKSKNIYISATKDGHYALNVLFENGKKIHEIINYPKEKSDNISDYIDFNDLAKKYRLKITYTDNVNTLTNRFSKERPNIIIVNGWSQLLERKLLKTAQNGCVGTHPSLLPKNRGRAPIAWHFINKEKYGGITLFFLEPTCDSGPIIDQIRFKIKETDNASSYYEKITKLGAKLLLKHFDSIVDGSARKRAIPQNPQKETYLLKRRPQDSYINFSTKTTEEVHDLVRAVSDIYPLANFTYKGKQYFVLSSKIPKNIPHFSGIPGQIARVSQDFMWVLTVQEIIQFTKVLDNNRNKVNLMETFKIGEVLNE